MAETNQLSTSEGQGELPPLSPAAIAAKKQMQKLVGEMEETERKRRIAEEKDEGQSKARVAAINKLITVQEDLLRFINLKKVREAEDLEQAQRITEEKKRTVHDELIRKSAQKEILKEEENERERRIKAEKDSVSDLSKERLKTYNRLVNVQEDLLRHVRKMEADLAMKEAQQEKVTIMNKGAMQEQLMHEVHRRQATEMADEERKRKVEELEHLTDEDIQQRVTTASKLLQVHKEMLAAREPTQPIPDHHTEQVLEDYKTYMQEQLVRKAHQKEAIEAMEKERQRRLEESSSSKVAMSDEKAAVLEEMSRKASSKQAKEMAEKTQQEYILDQHKAEVQGDAIRVINQKRADQMMDRERNERIKEMEGNPPAAISGELKKEITEYHK